MAQMNLSVKWKQNHGNREETYGYHQGVGSMGWMGVWS